MSAQSGRTRRKPRGSRTMRPVRSRAEQLALDAHEALLRLPPEHGLRAEGVGSSSSTADGYLEERAQCAQEAGERSRMEIHANARAHTEAIRLRSRLRSRSGGRGGGTCWQGPTLPRAHIVLGHLLPRPSIHSNIALALKNAHHLSTENTNLWD